MPPHQPDPWHLRSLNTVQAHGYTEASLDMPDAELLAATRADGPQGDRFDQLALGLANDLRRRYTITPETAGMLARVAANLRGLRALIESGIEPAIPWLMVLDHAAVHLTTEPPAPEGKD